MARMRLAYVVIMMITVLVHLSLIINDKADDDCQPRVLIKKEYVTVKNAPTMKPCPTYIKLPSRSKKKSALYQTEHGFNTSQNGQRPRGTWYQDIKPTKFKPNQKKKLLILGYQRVGSSFFGQLFDQNPNVFYVYEPLDAVYTEMYGTRGGLNVPSDITYHSNGTRRHITNDETINVLRLLTNILNCDVDKLPDGFMLHRFWDYLVESYMPSWKPYRACLDKAEIREAREQCRATHLGQLCPQRFGTNRTDQEYCGAKFRELRKYGRHKGPKIQPFIRYEDCLREAMDKGKKCVDIYREKCLKARVWATKTVRATMEQAERLMAANPNMRLIHLIRDPRPVVTSRSRDSSYRGVFSGVEQVRGGDKPKEAIIYCGTVSRDIKHRQTLEKRFPGRIIQVIYEDFVLNPADYTKAIYAFLDEPVPKELIPWIKSQTEGNQWKNNAMVRMNAWKVLMTYREGERVQENCKEFYDLVPYPWPY